MARPSLAAYSWVDLLPLPACARIPFLPASMVTLLFPRLSMLPVLRLCSSVCVCQLAYTFVVPSGLSFCLFVVCLLCSFSAPCCSLFVLFADFPSSLPPPFLCCLCAFPHVLNRCFSRMASREAVTHEWFNA